MTLRATLRPTLSGTVKPVMGSGSAPEPGVDNYLQPDGTSLYRRPDGTSLYKRPLGS